MIGRLKDLSPEIARFFSTAAMGLALDLAIALALIAFAGFSDYLAAAGGLFAGMVFNYFVHLSWTFRGHKRKASFRHFLQFSASVGITLVVRLAILAGIAMAGWQALLPAFVRLGIAAAASFVLSYLLCRYLIFGPSERASGE